MSYTPFKEKEVLPTKDNVFDAFDKDPVNRANYVFSLYEMMNQTPFEVSSISIEGQWGSGKTFFIKMLMMLIHSQDNTDLEDPHKECIQKKYYDYLQDKYKDEIKKEVTENKIFPIYYDAWKNDLMPSPVLSSVN